MLEISEKELTQSLEQDNPWWTQGFSVGTPPFLKKRAYLESFKRLSLNWNIRRAVVLMGPRRAGKTVLLQQLIEHILKTELNGENVFFVSVDTPLYSGYGFELSDSALFEYCVYKHVCWEKGTSNNRDWWHPYKTRNNDEN